MRYLTVMQVIDLHTRLLAQSGGLSGIRDRGGLDAAVAQPRMTFGGVDLYPTLIDKAAALGFSLISNHPFIDGNKRIGHLAMETFLFVNGCEIDCPVDEQEQVILKVAAGEMERPEFVSWLQSRITAGNR